MSIFQRDELTQRLKDAEREVTASEKALATAEHSLAAHPTHCETTLTRRAEDAEVDGDLAVAAAARAKLSEHLVLHAQLRDGVTESQQRLTRARQGRDEAAAAILDRDMIAKLHEDGPELLARVERIKKAAVDLSYSIARLNLDLSEYRKQTVSRYAAGRVAFTVDADKVAERFRNLEREVNDLLLAEGAVRYPGVAGLKGIWCAAVISAAELPQPEPAPAVAPQAPPGPGMRTSFGFATPSVAPTNG